MSEKTPCTKTKKSHKSQQLLSLPFFSPLFSFPPLSKLSLLSRLKFAACTCFHHESVIVLIMHQICTYPQQREIKPTQHPFHILVLPSCSFHLSYNFTMNKSFYHRTNTMIILCHMSNNNNSLQFNRTHYGVCLIYQMISRKQCIGIKTVTS